MERFWFAINIVYYRPCSALFSVQGIELKHPQGLQQPQVAYVGIVWKSVLLIKSFFIGVENF